MKNRTIEELHDKEIGHKKFAKVVDIMIERGHQVTDIREGYEKFKFTMDNNFLEYDKNYKASAKSFVEYCEKLAEQQRHILLFGNCERR